MLLVVTQSPACYSNRILCLRSIHELVALYFLNLEDSRFIDKTHGGIMPKVSTQITSLDSDTQQFSFIQKHLVNVLLYFWHFSRIKLRKNLSVCKFGIMINT